MLNLIFSFLLSFAPDTCEPSVEHIADPNGAIEADACGAPLCVFDDGTPTTKDCDNSCSWIPGSVITCGEWTCTPIPPGSACRWTCIPTP